MELIDNKLVVDAAIGALTAPASLVVESTGPALLLVLDADTGVTAQTPRSCVAPCALYPADTADRFEQETGGSVGRGDDFRQIHSDRIRDDTLNGPSKLQYGFDIKNADDTVFVNAYTDIEKTKLGDNPATSLYDANGEITRLIEKKLITYLTTPITCSPEYGLQRSSGTIPRITAFAYGSEPITGSKNFCTVSQNSGTMSGTSLIKHH